MKPLPPPPPAVTLFVTGTDTGVGKTQVARELLRLSRGAQVPACGWKPVASGCEATPEGLRNDDALALQQAAGTAEPYERVNPYAFAPAVAPHLAAAAAERPIRVAELNRVHAGLCRDYRLIVAEGAGGWQVPLDRMWTTGTWVAEREWPVLLVVGMRLGCLNHALLAVESIARRAPLAGWVASVLPPAMDLLEQNIATLRERISAPCWGVLRGDPPRFDDGAAVTERLLALLPPVE